MTDTLLTPMIGPDVSRPTGRGSGRVFYVDHVNGNNANNGLSPNSPFATITYALTACSADFGDYIFVVEHGAAGAEPAYPVVINRNKVHVIGVGRHGPDQVIRIHADANNVFDVTGRDVEIAGFGFDSDSHTGGGIVASTSVFGAWIHHCHFAGSSLGQGLLFGIGVAGQQGPWWLIEDNVFSSPNGVGITTFGIRLNVVAGTIRRNYFTCCDGGASPCIRMDNVEIGAIVDNYFYCPISDTGAVGWAITLVGAGMEGGPITNNHAMQTGDGTGLNPYRDTSSPGDITAVSHGWGANYDGPALSLGPAVA